MSEFEPFKGLLEHTARMVARKLKREQAELENLSAKYKSKPDRRDVRIVAAGQTRIAILHCLSEQCSDVQAILVDPNATPGRIATQSYLLGKTVGIAQTMEDAQRGWKQRHREGLNAIEKKRGNCLAILVEVKGFERQGFSRNKAVKKTAQQRKVSDRTIWRALNFLTPPN